MSLGGLMILLAAGASVMLAFSTPPADATRVALASRVGVEAPLADSLRGVDPDDLDPVDAAALDGVDASGVIWLGRQRLELSEDVVAFYRQRSLAPVWTDSTARETLLQALREARLDGLDPEAFHATALDQTLRGIYARDPKTPRPLADTVAADLDLALTDALFRYAETIGGRIDPADLYGSLTVASRQRPDVAALLAERLATADDPASGVRDVLAQIVPQHEGYQNLRLALKRVLDEPGADTLDADVLRLNLERWRWLPSDLGDRHVLVDVPGYHLRFRERTDTGFEDAFTMKVVVGQPGRWQTPVMTDTMETIVFSPTWTIPASIQMESYGYVQRGGRVMPPGPRNPMGRVKFLFPNDQAIYIHDTNSKWGFSRDYRALSHGCVRAADPRDFATAVLTRTNGWTAEEVAERFEGRWTPETVRIEGTLPVHLTYFTAWADASGRITLSPDIYRRDAALADALGLSI